MQSCEDAFFDDQDCVSPKPREVMWRKGYYDTISMAKRFIHKHQKSQAALGGDTKTTLDGMENLCLFIEEGMLRLKKVILRIEKDYNLDLKYVVDFSLFDTGDVELPLAPEAIPINKKITSLEIINFALESIHALIVSLGDLHRYYLDFNLHREFSAAITQDLTAQYYEAAFKLNPKNGMPQNQLGTLWIGRNHNLDAVYHYLYSLVCAKPFALSEDNVAKIFHQSAAYLEALVMPPDYRVNKRDFIARFLLVVDIFFFDKSVPTFNDLCRFLLCDLNSMLRQKSEEGEAALNQDLLFKLTSILFFCMRKLKRNSSPKAFQLNAFLAAICDQFVESCNGNFKEFFEAHEAENAAYRERYQEVYDEVVQGRQRMNGQGHQEEHHVAVNGENGMKFKGGSTGEEEDEEEEGEVSSGPNGLIKSEVVCNGAGRPVSVGKKRVMKYRRRRRLSTYTSDSDLTSNFDSDSEKSEEEEGSDFSDDDSHDDDDEEEEDNYASGGERGVKAQQNGFNHHPELNEDDNSSDVLIEEETVVITVNGKTTTITATPSDDSAATQESGNDPLEGQLTALAIDGEREDGQRKRVRQKVSLPQHDPNLLLQFVATEPTIRALKVLFDWLMDNKEIVWECFQSNPEFVHRMMQLLNTVNVNIFTRRVFFDRRLLTVAGLREDVRGLFDARAKLPLAEDFALKHFGEFARAQEGLDWELSAQLQVTAVEEQLLRVVKLKNFGFFICDRKKFGYAFRNCRFEEVDAEQAKRRKNAKKGERRDGRKQQQQNSRGWYAGGGESQGSGGSGENRRDRRRRQRRMMMVTRGGELIGEPDGNNNNHKNGNGRRQRRGQGSNNGGGGGGRKGASSMRREEGHGDEDGRRMREEMVSRETERRRKGELMGKLWLRNEVKNLETKVGEEKGLVW